jgi:hypothetical protein
MLTLKKKNKIRAKLSKITDPKKFKKVAKKFRKKHDLSKPQMNAIIAWIKIYADRSKKN